MRVGGGRNAVVQLLLKAEYVRKTRSKSVKKGSTKRRQAPEAGGSLERHRTGELVWTTATGARGRTRLKAASTALCRDRPGARSRMK